MKYILVIALFAVANAELSKEFIDKTRERLHAIGVACVKEVNANDDDAAELIAHKIPSSHEGKCVIFCVGKQLGMFTDDGKLTPDKFLEQLEAVKEQDAEIYGKMKTVLDTCTKEVAVDADPCIHASNLVECKMRVGKELGIDGLLSD